VLSLITADDRHEQVTRYVAILQRQFGVKPRGCWLFGQVWEQHLAADLARAGINYTILDDTQFSDSDPAITGYQITEDEGLTLAVFPANTRLRHIAAARPPADVARVLHDLAQYDEPRIVTLVITSHQLANQPDPARWLEQLLAELQRLPDLACERLSDLLDQHPAQGLIYLDNAASPETDDPLAASPAYFRRILQTSPVANRLHKRTLYVSGKLRRSRKTPEQKDQARRRLLSAQTGDAYLSGLHDSATRQAAYSHLLQADILLAENPGFQLLDYDACGTREVIYDYQDIFLAISPPRGGVIAALDDKTRAVSWTDALTPSPYLLRDHFYPLTTTAPQLVPVPAPDGFSLPESFGSSALELLSSLASAPRHYELEPHRLIMTVTDFIPEKPSHLYKEINIHPSRLLVIYDLHVNFWQPYRFAVEFNLLPVETIAVNDTPLRPLSSPVTFSRVQQLALTHFTGARLLLRTPKTPFDAWFYPLIASHPESLNRSTPRPAPPAVSGVPHFVQGLRLILSWQLHKPAAVCEFELQCS
jgi:hypothetical protein